MSNVSIQVGYRAVANGRPGRLPVKQLYTAQVTEETSDLFEEKDGWNFRQLGTETTVVIPVKDDKDYPTDLNGLHKLIEHPSVEMPKTEKLMLLRVIETMMDNGEKYILTGNRGLWMTKNHGLVKAKEI